MSPPGREDALPVSETQSTGPPEAHGGEEKRAGLGVQEWPDGSRYEGEFVNGLKHGKGKYTWSNGEYYEGSFYKDYRHGAGLYCWPTGHTFTGTFYLNRNEGYGQQVFPDGTTFQGLYHVDKRFGPGVMSYPDGRQDVGLWIGNRLLQLCGPVEEGFSLRDLPGYVAYMDPSATTDYLTQLGSRGLQSEAGTGLKVALDRDLPADEDFILPPGIEHYSSDGDYLPLPPGRRRELDQLFYGELWEPEPYPHQGYERDLLAALPLQARIQANIHKHRLQARDVSWDVDALLALNRETFGPRGPSEVHSEMFIQHAARGEKEAMLQIFTTGLVHPDVADSQGHTALIAATVNCHYDVIHFLLDIGADIDKLNREGMSALAVCHVLYYPFRSLHTICVEPLTQNQGSMALSPRGQSSQISQTHFTTVTFESDDRPQNNQCQLFDQGAEHILNGSSVAPEDEAASHAESRRHQERKQGEEERETESRCDRVWGNRESEVGGELESRVKKEEDVAAGVRRESGSEKENIDARQLVEEDVVMRMRNTGEGEPDGEEIVPAHMATLEGVQGPDKEQSGTEIHQPSDAQETGHKATSTQARRCGYLNTLRLLLSRGADPNVSRVPLPVLFLAIMAADTEAVRTLLLCGARTDITLPPQRKGLYPLHAAAALPGPAGPEITELLLHAIPDPDAQACDQDDIYEPDKILLKTKEPLNTSQNPHLKEGGRTALHVACQRHVDHQNATKVVSLLLSYRASTDLLWSGHSPLSLAISSGNNLAVEELLSRGANPNIPLGRRVGSALCALANVNYHLGDNGAKLLDTLAKAGADILMPLKVGDVMGTAVDYAHHSFNQDLHIARTPFHALTVWERETYNTRHELLSLMADLLRKAVCQREREQQLTLSSSDGCERPPTKPEKRRKPVFKFCYHCGRSVSVKLVPCSRCHKVFYCSRNCKLKAWQEIHKEECVQLSASADSIQKTPAFKPQRGPRPMTAMSRPKTVPRALSFQLKPLRVAKSLSVAEKLVKNQVNEEENYSFN